MVRGEERLSLNFCHYKKKGSKTDRVGFPKARNVKEQTLDMYLISNRLSQI